MHYNYNYKQIQHLLALNDRHWVVSCGARCVWLIWQRSAIGGINHAYAALLQSTPAAYVCNSCPGDLLADYYAKRRRRSWRWSSCNTHKDEVPFPAAETVSVSESDDDDDDDVMGIWMLDQVPGQLIINQQTWPVSRPHTHNAEPWTKDPGPWTMNDDRRRGRWRGIWRWQRQFVCKTVTRRKPWTSLSLALALALAHH